MTVKCSEASQNLNECSNAFDLPTSRSNQQRFLSLRRHALSVDLINDRQPFLFFDPAKLVSHCSPFDFDRVASRTFLYSIGRLDRLLFLSLPPYISPRFLQYPNFPDILLYIPTKRPLK